MRSPRSLNQNNLYQSTLTIQNSYDLPMAITYIIVICPTPGPVHVYVAKEPPYSKHVYRNIAIYKCYICMYSYLFDSFSEKRRYQKQ